MKFTVHKQGVKKVIETFNTLLEAEIEARWLSSDNPNNTYVVCLNGDVKREQVISMNGEAAHVDRSAD